MSNESELKGQALVEHLIFMGALEMDGIDSDTGEMIYSITDKLQHVSPDMYEILTEEFQERMYEMIYAGPQVMKWKFDMGFFK
jgi:hypothetical protein